jgi:hypothetical protein
MPIGSAMLALHTELVVTMKPVYQVKFEQLDVAASGKWTSNDPGHMHAEPFGERPCGLWDFFPRSGSSVDPGLAPQKFRIGQEYFPRNEEHTPEWMARRIREV